MTCQDEGGGKKSQYINKDCLWKEDYTLLFQDNDRALEKKEKWTVKAEALNF